MPEAFYFEETSKKTFLQTLNVDNPNYELVRNMVVFGKEMSLNQMLNHRHPFIHQLLTNDMMKRLKTVSWVIGLIFNIIILVTYKLEENAQAGGLLLRRLSGFGFELGINIASYIFAFFTSAICVLWTRFKWGIEIKLNTEKYLIRHPSVARDDLPSSRLLKLRFVQSFWKSDYILSFVCHTIFSILGVFVEPFFHTLHLLLWLNISESSKYVLDSTTKRSNMLFQTLLLTIFVVYTYSSLTANFYSDLFSEDFGRIDVCQSLASCFVYSLNFGLRNGGGIGDSMKPIEFNDSNFGLKVLFDLSYFIIINTIILNIVFGIIVDTFGDMRDEQFRRAEVVENTCLICLNTKKDIQESKTEFEDHITYEHNIWNYVYFLNYLQHKRL